MKLHDPGVRLRFELDEAEAPPDQPLVASGDGIPTGLIIAAHPVEVTQSRARVKAVTYCLSKPFASDDLLECVRAALALSKRGSIPRG